MWKLIVYVTEGESAVGGGERVKEVEVFVPTIPKGRAAIKKIMKEGVYGETPKNLSYYPPSRIIKIAIVAMETPMKGGDVE